MARPNASFRLCSRYRRFLSRACAQRARVCRTQCALDFCQHFAALTRRSGRSRPISEAPLGEGRPGRYSQVCPTLPLDHWKSNAAPGLGADDLRRHHYPRLLPGRPRRPMRGSFYHGRRIYRLWHPLDYYPRCGTGLGPPHWPITRVLRQLHYRYLGLHQYLTEHRWGTAWVKNDWQHTTMGVIWWCAGLAGIWLSRDRDGNPKRNFIPGFVIFITGWGMSAHPQELMVSAMTHTMFGYTLMAAGLTRIIEIAFVLKDAQSLSEDGRSWNSFQFIPPFVSAYCNPVSYDAVSNFHSSCTPPASSSRVQLNNKWLSSMAPAWTSFLIS